MVSGQELNNNMIMNRFLILMSKLMRVTSTLGALKEKQGVEQETKLLYMEFSKGMEKCILKFFQMFVNLCKVSFVEG